MNRLQTKTPEPGLRGTILTDTLVPHVTNPFIIVTPPYARVSAGVTVLHLLCHYLNRLGENAYLVHYPTETAPIRTLPSYAALQQQREIPGGMITPLVTQDLLEYFDEQRLTPIVIYPEVYDNPLDAKFFGRYILNYPGKLNAKYEQKEQFNFAYTKILAEHTTATYREHSEVRDVLFLPTSDLSFWNTSGALGEREGSCYYAGKTKDIFGATAASHPEGSTEILRSKKMTRLEVREIFWRSKAFYCYEDTALAIEAQLCGCPTVFVPNDHFSGRPLAFHELGTNGSCTMGETGGLERARNSVADFEHTIRRHIAAAPSRIAELAAKWKTLAASLDYQGMIHPRAQARIVFFARSIPLAVGFETDGSNAYKAESLSFFRVIRNAWGLIRETRRTAGIGGVIARVASGVRRHGLVGVARRLRGIFPK